MNLLAILCAGCHDMQPTPVASPSTQPIAPPTVPQPAPPASVPRFVIDLHENGTATPGQPWSTTAVVLRTEGDGVPASVSFDCGTGSGARVVAGFIGSQVVTCSFPAAGEYAVSAAVVAPNGVTASDRVTVRALAPAVPEGFINIDLRRLGPTANGEEYLITVSGAQSGSIYRYDFGDGTNRTTDQSREQHIYANGTYRIEVTATQPSGHVLRASNNVVVPSDVE